MIALLTGNWKVLLYIAIAAALAFAVHKYNDSVRAPLEREIKFLTDSIEANKKQATAMVLQREKENADLAEKWRNYARQSDDDYEKKIAALRASGSSGLRIFTGCGASGSPAGQASTGRPEAPAKPAAESGVGNAAPEVVFGVAEIGQVLQWYEYGMSCHAAINRK